MNFKKRYRKLYRLYKKDFNKARKFDIYNPAFNLDYLYTQLRYLRDYYILTSDSIRTLDPAVTSLAVAVEQYELYTDCLYNYYSINEAGVITAKDDTDNKDEVLSKYIAEKAQHWSYFWITVCSESANWLSFKESERL